MRSENCLQCVLDDAAIKNNNNPICYHRSGYKHLDTLNQEFDDLKCGALKHIEEMIEMLSLQPISEAWNAKKLKEELQKAFDLIDEV